MSNMNIESVSYKVLYPGLVYYENILPFPQQIIDSVNNIDKMLAENKHQGSFTEMEPWISWRVDDREVTYNSKKFFPKPDQVSSLDYYANLQIEISNRLYNSLDLATEHYLKIAYPLAKKSVKAREYNQYLTKYEKNGGLPRHYDQENASSRVLSSVLYLNDDYSGGELWFSELDITIKPSAGSIVMFPSSFIYVHEVKPIINGSRYAMPHWYHNVEDWHKNIQTYDIEQSSGIID